MSQSNTQIDVKNIDVSRGPVFDDQKAYQRIEQMRQFWFNRPSSFIPQQYEDPGAGPLNLLIIQGSPYCNANCTYCYLPDRQSKVMMTDETLEATARRVFESGAVGKSLSIVWHAGEPLALPLSFYEKMVATFDKYNVNGTELNYIVQTNGIPIDDKWCDFFEKHNVHVGMSIDGPAEIHDIYRINWKNQGTHKLAMRGVRRLKARGIPFSVISVLTKEALAKPDEIFAFFHEIQPMQLGFNVDEQEAYNTESSMQGSSTLAEYSAFMQRILELNKQAGDTKLRLREYNSLRGAIANGDPARMFGSEENLPFRIVSVAVNGDYSTFSPELLGQDSADYGNWTLGNVHTDSFQDALQSDKFNAMWRDIRAGIEKCRHQCGYYSVCGGGAPANKVAENGSADSTETMTCKLMTKSNCEFVLDRMQTPAFDSYSLYREAQ